jgi:hypothetical protein
MKCSEEQPPEQDPTKTSSRSVQTRSKSRSLPSTDEPTETDLSLSLDDPDTLLPSSLTPEGEGALVSFFDLEGVGLALKSTNFTREEMVRRLVIQCRDPSPKVSQKAMNMLLRFMKDSLALNGKIGVARIKQESSNGQVHTVSTSGILRKLGSAPGAQQENGRIFKPPVPRT